jgi:hypothetical protein
MGVEQWVYDLLGRPKIEIAGEVVSDLATHTTWINVPRDVSVSTRTTATRFRDVRLRGGCELEVLAHYFKAQSTSCAAEYVTTHGSFAKPTHNSAVLSKALSGLTDSDLRLLKILKMDPSYFETEFFSPCSEDTLLVYSPTTDARLTVFRHRKSGFELPLFTPNYLDPSNKERTKSEIDEFNRIATLAKQYYEKIPSDDLTKHMARYKTILDHVPENALLVVLLPNYLENKSGRPEFIAHQAALNELFKAAGKDRPNVRFIEMTSLLETIDDVLEAFHLHFRRAVYRRLYETIEQTYLTWMEQTKRKNRAQSGAQGETDQLEFGLPHAQKPHSAVAELAHV